MSKQRGQLLTCDRCGKTIFLKELEAKEKDTDGGYTRWNEYKHEKPPEEWTHKYFGDYSHKYDLCPECAERFKREYNIFFEIAEDVEGNDDT